LGEDVAVVQVILVSLLDEPFTCMDELDRELTAPDTTGVRPWAAGESEVVGLLDAFVDPPPQPVSTAPRATRAAAADPHLRVPMGRDPIK
jgi:hypothetical protein